MSRTTNEQQANNEPAASTSQSNELEAAFKSLTIDQLLGKLHQLLIQCQSLGDQKVKLTGQIMETLGNKTRQIGLDAKLNGMRIFDFCAVDRLLVLVIYQPSRLGDNIDHLD